MSTAFRVVNTLAHLLITTRYPMMKSYRHAATPQMRWSTRRIISMGQRVHYLRDRAAAATAGTAKPLIKSTK